MIVYRMSKIMSPEDRDDPELPETEFSAHFNTYGWTQEGTLASKAFASFDDLQTHMNAAFSNFVEDGPASAWRQAMGDVPFPLHVFQQSGWVLEWADPEFKPLDEYDESDAQSSAAKLSDLITE